MNAVSSGGFSPTRTAETVQHGFEDTCPGVLVGPGSPCGDDAGVDVACSAGAGVGVGRAGTSVNESCACTVCATAVAISESLFAGEPHEEASSAIQVSRRRMLYLLKRIYFPFLWGRILYL